MYVHVSFTSERWPYHDLVIILRYEEGPLINPETGNIRTAHRIELEIINPCEWSAFCRTTSHRRTYERHRHKFTLIKLHLHCYLLSRPIEEYVIPKCQVIIRLSIQTSKLMNVCSQKMNDVCKLHSLYLLNSSHSWAFISIKVLSMLCWTSISWYCHAVVTIDRVLIGNWIYWTLTDRNYK
jgi:hypothetical protein